MIAVAPVFDIHFSCHEASRRPCGGVPHCLDAPTGRRLVPRGVHWDATSARRVVPGGIGADEDGPHVQAMVTVAGMAAEEQGADQQ
jgi:hypothetical protein